MFNINKKTCIALNPDQRTVEWPHGECLEMGRFVESVNRSDLPVKGV